jgi:hypothetical protein
VKGGLVVEKENDMGLMHPNSNWRGTYTPMFVIGFPTIK